MTDYTDQQNRFVEVFLEESRTNANHTEVGKLAREAAGYSDDYPVHKIIAVVKDLIIEGLQLHLAKMAPKMINRLEGVVDNPSTPGAKNVLTATMTLLDRAGIIKKEETTINLKTPNGILILPAKQQVNDI